MSGVSIVTKKGDRGRTSLYCGTKVPKDDIRMEACGDLDEVSSFLGLAKSATKDSRTKSIISDIQKELVVLCSEVAVKKSNTNRSKKRVDAGSVCALEKEIDCMENKCGIKIRTFCLQGVNPASSALDVARAVTRRAERRCVTMARKNILKNRNIIIYLNRLSDLLYLLARFNEKRR